ncbi:hypothetical protein MPH_08725 [Macrophomina phaseolina MS6]|uniref:FHA domain-containing protein n=1 Tax=Macrophomina phaseolina (strain MS6) TaxID=1126212 RepID=K2SB66_MACPH|nr:hypothetical protein MPH_08725 [Macrophomina phaseolina MS6]
MDSPAARQYGPFAIDSSSPSRPVTSSPPKLLPAFEPLSSPLPRVPKRKLDDNRMLPKVELKYYPTPMPTSSTGILPSSPTRQARPGLQRTLSALSERNPLCAVPSIEVPANGEPVLMGRSSNSSHHQLSANRLISRVHVRAVYHAPTEAHASGQVVIECLGWNGAKVHCRGQIYDLAKGDTFSSDRPSADIMLDVQDTRVLLVWPLAHNRRRSISAGSDTTWEEQSPTKKRAISTAFNSSPPPFAPQSPESLVPQAANSNDETFLASDPADLEPPAVQVYEDGESGDDKAKVILAESQSSRAACASTQEGKDSQTSISSFESDDFSDRDEENDPVVHSFGPFGANILSRMQSMSNASNGAVSSQQRRRRPLKDARSRPESPDGALSNPDAPRISSEPTRRINESPIKNHVINQLAFSRLHSMPLSTIFGNLPTDLRGGSTDGNRSRRTGKGAMMEEQAAESMARLTGSDLQQMLDSIPCIGEITRVGKDASGHALENEYYYVPEMDDNQMRRDAVVGGIGGTGLRSVRKAHKQYYWKRPRY